MVTPVDVIPDFARTAKLVANPRPTDPGPALGERLAAGETVAFGKLALVGIAVKTRELTNSTINPDSNVLDDLFMYFHFFRVLYHLLWYF